ncbi:hypothetical protein F7P74_07655 [Helicobacter pullorum NCTC 12824]|uniref:aldolase catalytic domain-containing protein n=1 Tax=Helicobacter pullorum TaxID=35818 RepID=UPI0012460CCD|nr:aldolase catalytic domain-containing protein [Helicobacter pullorum]KAB0574157.1 hypothetical protein F7P74_07655 [Helicobacter pullorum NCTC 12824]
MPIQVLDCTLRDGGYVNNFSFSKDCVADIVTLLEQSKVEFIEIGFLKNTKEANQTTIFSCFDEFNFLHQCKKQHSYYVAMIVYGKFDVDKIPKKEETIIDCIRVTFKKNEITQAIQFIKLVKDKGYMVSANPTGINDYSNEELLELVNLINKTNFDMFAIVDTLGVLTSKQLLQIFELLNKKLKNNIKICFHSHNNLQLSFSNACELIDYSTERNIIVDSSCKGMGRGAGNLCTELILFYLNSNYHATYNLIPILQIIDKYIEPLSHIYDWGYTLPYYIASIHNCHPNYAIYLSNKQKLTAEQINNILMKIPDNQKNNYNEKLIQQLYLSSQNISFDDTYTLEYLQTLIQNRRVLIIGPGVSIDKNKEHIVTFIKEENPFIIMLNFHTDNYKSDLVFVNNQKRFNTLDKTNLKIMITSNIIANNITNLVLDYNKYLGDSHDCGDNTLVVLLNVLINIKCKDIFIAGCDGYDINSVNYADTLSEHITDIADRLNMNRVIANNLKKLRQFANIKFITRSKYDI